MSVMSDEMTGFDFAVLAILLVSLLFGLWRGLVYEVIVAAGLADCVCAEQIVCQRRGTAGAGAVRKRRYACHRWHALVFIAALIVWGMLAWFVLTGW